MTARIRRALICLAQSCTQTPTLKASFHSSPSLVMKVARVTAWGSPPEYTSAPDLPPPSPTQLQLRVVAVGVPRAVRGRAAGQHPSAKGAPLPFDPSIDGVGRDDTTGELYFINSLAAPLFAERANVERSQLMKLPAGADPALIAGLSNPTGSSYMALRCRAIGGCAGRTVAILGATSASGRIAAIVARQLGAARVIGLARNEATLAAVEGLDVHVCLRDPLILPDNLGPVHIVLDYVGGPAAVQLLQALQPPPGENLQYIVVGGLAGYEQMDLPLRLINVKPIILMGSGKGSLSMADFDREMPGLVNTLANMGRTLDVDVLEVPMADVQSVWDSEEMQTKRMVIMP
ncbi:hypothetical protein BJX96DRAFT_182488 [Aspergillus floccosus]